MATNSELLTTIENALNEVMAYEEIAVIGYGNIDEQVPAAQAALEILRTRIADLEALATLANDWFGTTAVENYEQINRWQQAFQSIMANNRD